MSTDFFTSQDNARRQTGRLVMLFVFGVAATMVALWAVIAGAMATQVGARAWADPRIAGGVFVVVGAIVGIATLVKLAQLSQGGSKIAEMLGGVPVDPTTRDPGERQLLNIVEEMSIASGVPVPPVYVLEDQSVNAFAAGPDPSRSVIGVTRGCMELLSRDELQGVIAHEYSHIFHGDTRINARTTAVIAGIMAVGLLGFIMFRHVGPALARSGGRGRKNNGAAVGVAIVLIGLAFWAIGSLGMLFGRLIQAAISRQREFLADAAAVQYTRNPDGIAGALAKIRDHYSGRIENAHASELNHFFFCSSLNTLFATHPPIDERIGRIVAMGAAKVGASEAARPRSGTGAPTGRPAAGGTAGLAGATAAIAQAGTLDAESIARARAFRESLSPDFAEAARDPEGARAICYAVARQPSNPAACESLVRQSDPECLAAYLRVAPAIAALRPDAQLALVDLAAPALGQLGASRYGRFREILAHAVRGDGRIDLREWALVKSLERHVERRFTRGVAPARGSLAQHEAEARMVIAIVAGVTHSGDGVARSFELGLAAIGLRGADMPSASTRTLDALNAATKSLAGIAFTERARLLHACAAAAAHDGEVSIDEFLVVRAVADALDVPVPALAGGPQ